VWDDEKNRRSGHGLDNNMDWFIDLSPNIDRKLAVKQNDQPDKHSKIDVLQLSNQIHKDKILNKLTTNLIEL
jgi:hypothetical protein